MGVGLVVAGVVVGAFVLGRGDKEEGPAVWLAWGLIGVGVMVLTFAKGD
ncbi:hypothetical protein [Methylobacterium sp. Leaf113]|nr:hypothetical protein [Methylobacterium sp. Leaf113]